MPTTQLLKQPSFRRLTCTLRKVYVPTKQICCDVKGHIDFQLNLHTHTRTSHYEETTTILVYRISSYMRQNKNMCSESAANKYPRLERIQRPVHSCILFSLAFRVYYYFLVHTFISLLFPYICRYMVYACWKQRRSAVVIFQFSSPFHCS